MHSKLNDFTVFCEDIRSEANNKISLIGCVQDVLFFHSEYPTSFRLHAVCHVHVPESGNLDEKSLYLTLPGSKQKDIDLSSVSMVEAGSTMRAILELSSFQFIEDGEILIHIRQGKGKKELIGRLRIQRSEKRESFVPIDLSKDKESVSVERKKAKKLKK